MINEVIRYQIPDGREFKTSRKAQEAILDGLQIVAAGKLRGKRNFETDSAVYSGVCALFDSAQNGTDRQHAEHWQNAVDFLNEILDVIGYQRIAKNVSDKFIERGDCECE